MAARKRPYRVRAKGDPQEPHRNYAGYYNSVRRRPGDVFDLLYERHFSEKWMEWVSQKAEKTPAPGEPTEAERKADRGGSRKVRDVIGADA